VERVEPPTATYISAPSVRPHQTCREGGLELTQNRKHLTLRKTIRDYQVDIRTVSLHRIGNMRRGIKDRWEVFGEAAGPRKYVIGTVIAAIIFAIDWIEDQAQSLVARWLSLDVEAGGPEMILGAPSWIVGLTVLFALFWWWMLEYAVRLRRQLAPKLSLSFDENGGRTITPEKQKNETGATVDEWQTLYLRVCATALSTKTVENCSAYLVSIEKQDNAGVFHKTHFTDPMQLPWSHIGIHEINIPARVPHYIDVLRVSDRRQRLDFAAPWPLTLRGFFKDHTTYKLVVRVSGAGITKSKTLSVSWNGKWDELTVNENNRSA